MLAAAAAGILFLTTTHAASEPGPFFEADQPFFHTQVQVTPAVQADTVETNFVVRGILIPFPTGHALVFDQELLRIAGFWAVPTGIPPITPATMAQTSYDRPRRKAGSIHPAPTGPLLLMTPMHPGAVEGSADVATDPRPPGRVGDVGRGPLPVTLGRFEGIQLAGKEAVIHYRSGGTLVREWFQTKPAAEGAFETQLLRHLEIAPHSLPLHVVVGAAPESKWTMGEDRTAFSALGPRGFIRFATNTDAATLKVEAGALVATVAPSSVLQRLTLALAFTTPPVPAASSAPSASTPLTAPAPSAPTLEPARLMVDATPAFPGVKSAPRWPQTVTSTVQLDSLIQNGLTLDRIAVPEDNPWQRRVRPADIAFLDANRAAVVTYDGDVWLVSGLADQKLSAISWRRFASGLHESLAIAAPGGVIQVATKNGLVRLHDTDTNGESDWYENFSDQMMQSQSSRSFPLDMAVGPDGSTYVTQGGIVNESGIKSGGTGTPHTGAVLRISPDGRSFKVFVDAAREPFVAVHPQSGVVTGTDQQGHYTPTSVSYLMRQGDSFGFLKTRPVKLTPPLAWIPHELDTSSSSEVWMIGAGMGPWNGRLLHLSYGTGRLFVISPDLDAPVPQGAVIPLELKTDLPLLHARMHPNGDAVFLASFQIWGTRTTTSWGLGRLRPGSTPVVTAVGARSMAEGVILEFAEPINPSSLAPENIMVRAWNYQRSSEYGSGRYTLEKVPGTTAIGVGQIVASSDRKSVFVHLPKLPPIMQLELRHDFTFASGIAASGVVYFTINQPRTYDLAAAGFEDLDLSKSKIVVTQQPQELPTIDSGKLLAENLGCAGCHSADGTTEGKVGPTWKHLFGSRRTFVDGSSETADELYLRSKILDPMKKRVTTVPAEMPSYRGVVSESQLESLILYIKSLRRIASSESP